MWHNECKGKVDMGVKTQTQEGALFTAVEIHNSEDLYALEEQPKGAGDGRQAVCVLESSQEIFLFLSSSISDHN